MSNPVKIRIYIILQWILITLTFLLAIIQTLAHFVKTQEFSFLAFILEILLQPYLWIALILRWRIVQNKKIRLNEIDKQQN